MTPPPPPPPPPPVSVEGAGAVALPAPSALQLIRDRGGLRGVLPLLGPAFVAAIAYVDPGNFATNIAGGASYGYLLLWVVLAANLIGMLVQTAVGEGRPRDRQQPAGAVPRAAAASRFVRAVGAGRADRDGDRPRRVHRRGDRAQPAVRRAAVRRRPDDRRRRVRHPRACRRAATAASSWRSARCSRSSCSASSTRR